MPTCRRPSRASSGPLFVAACLATLSCGGIEPEPLPLPPIEAHQSAIIGGQLTSDYPAVGILYTGDISNPQAGVSLCTATLVGKQTLLTAAHCISPGDKHTFITDDGKQYPATQYVRHSGWNPNDPNLPDDIALLRLAAAPPVKPMLIADSKPSVGLPLTIVGYGETSEGKGDSGTKRLAKNVVHDLFSKTFTFAGVGGGLGNTCKGDSGGPAFATLGGRFVQVGITSAGVEPCGQLAYDTRVDAYRSWIITQAGGDLYQPETTPPTVQITAPANQATVGPSFTVRVAASDATGIAKVELRLDGTPVSTRQTAPYDFNMTNVPGGVHTLQAVATDYDGNPGSAQISVNVQGPSGEFGQTCTDHVQCKSNLCVATGTTRFCSQKCSAPGGSDCPQSAACLDAGGTFVCGPPPPGNNTNGPASTGGLVGGCAVTPDDRGDGALSNAATLGLVLLLALLWARRATRAS